MSDIQIVIPMSGFGERFRRAGYNVPKPLIPVDGKPIIGHVVDLFPGEKDVLFICNQEHLDEPEYRMAEQLRFACPTGQIVGIPPHRLGPVGAVLAAANRIDPDRPIVVNYCDFACQWDWDDFKSFVRETQSAGSIPAYRGFHPHSLGSTYYAYLQQNEGWALDIQEKVPFTDNPMSEFASSGTYYFESGRLCLELFQEMIARDLSVGGEYYVSLAYKILLERNRPVSIYELQHFMQWGTPNDLAEYLGWSAAFRRLAVDDARRARQGGTVLVPMAGYGKRFADAGYDQPKPLISVSGRPMVIQATRDLPDAPATKFILRKDTPGLDEIQLKLRTSFVGATSLVLDEGTDGQAITCQLGIADLAPDETVTIGACDNAMLYDVTAFEALFTDSDWDILIWVVKGHADGRLRPHMFGWVELSPTGEVCGVRVKSAPQDPTTAPMIVGAFTFRKARHYNAACELLVSRNARVNGEFYVDSLIEDALSLGLKCRTFEIDHYLGWGTPNDLKTFEYWQSCFHKWESHPYRLQSDRRIPPSQLPALSKRYQAFKPVRPLPRTGQANAQDPVPFEDPKKHSESTRAQVLRFIPVGGLAVLVDFLTYGALTALGMPPGIAKAVSFISGGAFAFFGNRHFTFRTPSGPIGGLTFCGVYAFSLLANILTNNLAIGLLVPTGLPFPAVLAIGFLVATSVSATLNFLGMKSLVFRGEKLSQSANLERKAKIDEI